MENDAARLDAIFLEMRTSLFRNVLRIVRDVPTAEELTQEAYLRTRKAIGSSEPQRLEAFLWQTTRNLALDHLRRSRVRSAVAQADIGGDELEDIPDQQPSAEERIIQKDDLRVLKAALEKLSPRARQVWLLSRVEGWPYPKIAAHLGVSPNTVFNDVKMVMGMLLDLRRRLGRHD